MDNSPYQAPPPPTPYTAPGPAAAFYPLTIGRTVSLSFSLFRFGWRTFVAINLIAAVPVVLATAVITLITYDQMNAWQQTLMLSPATLTAAASADLVASFPWQAAALTFVVSLVVGAIFVIGSGALTHAIAAALGGGRLSTRESYSVALGRLRDLLIVYVIVALFGVGLSLLVVLAPLLLVAGPGSFGGGGLIAFLVLIAVVAVVFATAFLLIRTVFAVEVVILETLPGVASLRRSYSLVAGSMLRVLGYALVFGLILGLIGLAITFFALIVSFTISRPNLSSLTTPMSPAAILAQTLITNLLSEVFAPIFSIAFVLLYYDVRWRHGERVPIPGGGESAGPPRPEIRQQP